MDKNIYKINGQTMWKDGYFDQNLESIRNDSNRYSRTKSGMFKI